MTLIPTPSRTGKHPGMGEPSQARGRTPLLASSPNLSTTLHPLSTHGCLHTQTLLKPCKGPIIPFLHWLDSFLVQRFLELLVICVFSWDAQDLFLIFRDFYYSPLVFILQCARLRKLRRMRKDFNFSGRRGNARRSMSEDLRGLRIPQD